MKTVKEVTKDGFAIENSFPDRNDTSLTSYHAPNLVAIENSYGNGAKQTLELHVSPSRPGFW
jgi:hypothetical protein